ncbi:MAG TPA: hypothetical protein VGY56_11395 [Verrucomicrobiae bacterium]|nr:hypothetical protein [Verrucomicrobiae bacterium]
MAAMIKITQDVIAMQNDNNGLFQTLLPPLYATDIHNAKASLALIKLVVVSSPCIAQAAREQIIAVIDNGLAKVSAAPSAVEGIKKLKRDIVLPEDLFGS